MYLCSAPRSLHAWPNFWRTLECRRAQSLADACMSTDPRARPPFTEVVQQLTELRAAAADDQLAPSGDFAIYHGWQARNVMLTGPAHAYYVFLDHATECLLPVAQCQVFSVHAEQEHAQLLCFGLPRLKRKLLTVRAVHSAQAGMPSTQPGADPDGL